MRRLQRKVQIKEGSTSCGIEEDKDALCSVFQSRLARIAHSLDSLMVVRDRDLELATIEGRMSEVQLFQGDEALSLQAQEVRLSAHNGALVAIEGDFDLIFAGLKSECVLQPCQGNSEGQDLVVEDVRGDVVAEDKDEAMGEGEVPSLDE